MEPLARQQEDESTPVPTGIASLERFPRTQEEADTLDKLLATEISGLSLAEQDQVTFELHGIAGETEETPNLLKTSFEQLEKELQKIKVKPAYEEAKYLNPDYVNNTGFQLSFLRSENFDCSSAARRLVFHFQKKAELFGRGDVLGRDIRLSDMDQDDMDFIKTGTQQVLPTRDVAGRSVVCFVKKHTEKLSTRKPICESRSFWYIMATTTKEVETQKKGFIIIVYTVGTTGGLDLGLIKTLQSMRWAIPHKLFGRHFCYDDNTIRPIVSGLQYLLDTRSRLGFRAHFGDASETRFQLQTYGISVSDPSPFQEVDGNLSLAWHEEWLRLRSAIEEADECSVDAIFPRRFDVLFGKGKTVREHTGNLRAGHLVNMWQNEYDKANKYQKTEIAERIVAIVHESHGRFLKSGEYGWFVVEHDVAREKVSQWFRKQRRGNSESGKAEGSASTSKRASPTVLPAQDAKNTKK
mmetsp:Transcript_43718/g.105442  ORF Transcript_43718/g.105442 Transcript_43718/m.105442 type:complete len:467 (-) Transcript_43718:158-1558(-)